MNDFVMIATILWMLDVPRFVLTLWNNYKHLIF